MKTSINSLFILISFLFSMKIYAQTGNSNIEILKPVQHTSYQTAGFLTVNENNKLKVESADASVTRLLVNANQGTVKQEGEDFIVTPANTGDLLLSVYNYNDIDNPILIEEKNMKVVSGPVASISGKNGGQISKEEFLKAEKVECSGNYTITEFKFSVAGKEIEFKEFFRTGDAITPAMISAVQQLTTGEKIFIEYIKATPENSKATRQIPPLTFTISD